MKDELDEFSILKQATKFLVLDWIKAIINYVLLFIGFLLYYYYKNTLTTCGAINILNYTFLAFAGINLVLNGISIGSIINSKKEFGLKPIYYRRELNLNLVLGFYYSFSIATFKLSLCRPTITLVGDGFSFLLMMLALVPIIAIIKIIRASHVWNLANLYKEYILRNVNSISHEILFGYIKKLKISYGMSVFICVLPQILPNFLIGLIPGFLYILIVSIILPYVYTSKLFQILNNNMETHAATD